MKSYAPVESCDVCFAFNLIGGKWKIIIIWKLAEKPMRFSELRRILPGISETVLIAQLKQLEKDKIVHRKDFKVVPPHVEYSVTQAGRELMPMLRQLEDWGGVQRAERQ